MPPAVNFPPPRDWQTFEDLCWDLWRRIWKDPDAQKYGLQGQEQFGVDIVGRRAGGVEGVQCKQKKRRLLFSEVEKEIDKARRFEPRLTRFIVATTAPKDPSLQSELLELNDSADGPPFSVSIFAWQDLLQELRAYPELIAKYSPGYVKDEVASGVLPVPNLPPHFLPRPRDLAPLTRALLASGTEKLGVTGSARHLVGVQGMGGIGKTVLAAAACRDAEVQTAFADGVVWITLGQEPNLLRLQQDLAKALGADDTVLGSAAEGRRVLERALAERSVLLVLDDVWDLQHASALDVVSAAGQLLVTTRNREILVGLGAEEIQLDVLSPEQSRALLADWAGESPQALPAVADVVAKECGHLPLALAMIGAMVRLRPTVWPDALERLRRADLDKIRQQFPDYPYPDLLRALDVSVEALDPQDRERYVELAVFPEDAAVPMAAIEVLWSMAGFDGLDTRDLVGRLVARSLAQLDEEGRMRLHDLQADYVRRQTEEARHLHQRLLDGYRARMPGGFACGEPDGYFHEHLAGHMARAGQPKNLCGLLSDHGWLEAKLRVSDLQSLLADYEELPASDPLRLVEKALRLSAHVLVKTPEELPSQLMGRLLDAREHDAIDRLLEGARRRGAARGWLRLLKRSLEAPGGVLQQTFDGRTDEVLNVAVLADGRVVSASHDFTLRVWDPQTGQTFQTLEGHTDKVSGVAALADGRVVSASNDRTLRVWDPQTGQTLKTLEGHTSKVRAVAALADGRVVSASLDGTLRVWDSQTGHTLKTFEGHTGVVCVAALADNRVVSASHFDTLRVWDPQTGQMLKTLKGHTDEVWGVATLADGRVVSASDDCTLRVWDSQTGRTLKILKGHTKWIRSVAAMADGRVVSASDDGTLRVWNTQTGQTLKTLEGHTGWVRGVSALADGRVISVSFDHTLRVWDPQADQALKTLEGHTDGVWGVATLADGRAVSASADRTLRVWDPQTGQTLKILEGHTGPVLDVAAMADGRVVSASEDRTLQVWDPQTGQMLEFLEGHPNWVWSVAVLADGRVVSASEDCTLRVWDPQTGQRLKTLKGHTEPVSGVAAMADGRVVSASYDHTLRVWDPQTGQSLKTLEGHTWEVCDVAAMADGRVVSASYDHTLRVWDPQTGHTLKTLEGHTDGVWGVAALAGGRVVSASRDRTLRVWDSQTGQTLATFHGDAGFQCATASVDSGNVVAGDLSGRLHWLKFEEATL